MTRPKEPPVAQPPRPRPWEQSADAEGLSFGTWLRRQREMREISLREIAESSRISRRYLEALEEDRFDVLPAPVFVKGFLREYAKLVGIDPDEVVNYYLTAQEGARAEEAQEQAPAKTTKSPRDWVYGLLLTLAVVVLLGGVALLAFYAERRRSTPAPPPAAVPVASTPPATAAKPAPPPSAPEAPLRVNLEFSADCWVEAQVDGKPRLSELRVQGESLQLEAQQSVLLSLGNGEAARIDVNGHPFAPPLGPHRVVKDLKIDLETLKGLGG